MKYPSSSLFVEPGKLGEPAFNPLLQDGRIRPAKRYPWSDMGFWPINDRKKIILKTWVLLG